MAFDQIAVIGAGAWGTALANVIARSGRSVTLGTRDPLSAAVILQKRESPRLPGVKLDDRVRVVAATVDSPRNDAILLAVPSQHLRAAAVMIAPALKPGTPIIACAKGIERGTHKFMTEVIAECAPSALPAILSGPSFAADVARGLPTAVTPYRSTDVRGVEIGGAAKNVLAIAAGIVSGRGLGASAAAALTTRGFAELFRFGHAFGARPETLTGLSGLGDLILTCSTAQSRNFSLGVAIGQGQAPREAQSARKLAEGACTAPVLVEMANEKNVEMPVAAAVAAILDGTMDVDAAIETLMTRPFKAEG